MTHPWAVVNSEQWTIAWQLDGLATLPASPLLPHRQPGVSLPGRSDEDEIPAVPRWRPEDIPMPPDTSHPDLLRRILKGLRHNELMRAPG